MLDVFHGRCYQQAYSINVTRSDGELLFIVDEGQWVVVHPRLPEELVGGQVGEHCQHMSTPTSCMSRLTSNSLAATGLPVQASHGHQ